MKKILVAIIVLAVIAFAATTYFVNKKSKELELTYSTNGGVPYKWEYEIEDKSIVKFEKQYEVEKEKNLDGGEVEVKYVFKGLKEGTTTITFRYINITNKEVEKEVVNKVKVDKDKNISLVSKK